MSLTPQQINSLLKEHKTELSALNAILRLTGQGGAALAIEDNAGLTRTPNILRTTGAGTIAPAVYDFSIFNAGLADGVFLGATIRPGETFSYAAGALNNIYAAATISYDGTGTELVILYNS